MQTDKNTKTNKKTNFHIILKTIGIFFLQIIIVMLLICNRSRRKIRACLEEWMFYDFILTLEGELKACQPDMSASEGHGDDHRECHHATSTGQPGYKAQLAYVYERQVLLDQPSLLL